MSLRKRSNGTYQYRFTIEGRAFSSSTGTSNKRDAERIEADARRKAEAEISAGAAATGAALTFGQATERFWNEVGTYYKKGFRSTIWPALRWLDEEFGVNTPLRAIGQVQVTEAIARRRGEGVANGTVNKTVTELLRRIWLRAREQWAVEVQGIKWKLLPEPKERIRALTAQEEADLQAVIPADYWPIIAFKIKSGFRLNEAVNLRQRDIDWKGGRIFLRGEFTKGGDPSTIPLSSELRALLTPLRAPTEFVFYFTAQQANKGNVPGERYPITYAGLQSVWKRHARKAGIADFRLHDLRHTAATRLGKHANIKVVQRFMRHADAATTAKYLHAFDDDVRAAMEAETQKRDAELAQDLAQGQKDE